MDFTLNKYAELMSELKGHEYATITFANYCKGNRPQRYAILRHDVDQKPANSLKTAEIEAEMGVKASYYFRAVPESWDEAIIKKIAELGHEVGYHYESLTTCNGDTKAAYEDFRQHLEALRQLTTVETICMHGSPRSPYDSKDIWNHYSYRDLGIIGEPYLDTDFAQMFYLTDTGRRWDGYKVSVRDKIEGYQDEWTRQGLTFHTTDDIINAIKAKRLPEKVMFTTHPQRWNDFGLAWVTEIAMQNMKNVVKRFIVARGK